MSMSAPEPITGYCAVVRQGRTDRHWERYQMLAVHGAKPPGRKDMVRLRALPPFWPKTPDFITCRLAKDLVGAVQPSSKDHEAGQLSAPRLLKAGRIAGYLAQHLEVESFIVVTQADGFPTAIHSIGMQVGDHAGSEHVLNKARKLFYDLPHHEHPYLFEDIRTGALLTEREREGIVPGRTFEGLIDADSHYARHGSVERDGARPLVPVPPTPVAQKAEVEDPGLLAALERLRLATGC